MVKIDLLGFKMSLTNTQVSLAVMALIVVVALVVLCLTKVFCLNTWFEGAYDNVFKEGFAEQEGVLANDKATVILFYAPWCPHCKDIMPKWNSLEKKYKDHSRLRVKKINCDEHQEEAEKNQIEGYPTIILFKDGKKINLSPSQLDNIENFV